MLSALLSRLFLLTTDKATASRPKPDILPKALSLSHQCLPRGGRSLTSSVEKRSRKQRVKKIHTDLVEELLKKHPEKRPEIHKEKPPEETPEKLQKLLERKLKKKLKRKPNRKPKRKPERTLKRNHTGSLRPIHQGFTVILFRDQVTVFLREKSGPRVHEMSTATRKGGASSSSSRRPPSKKRKMDGGSGDKEQKYYAVRAGHKPGVYTSWAICQQQISGFKGALFKSFLSYEDASAFAEGRTPPSATSSAATKFYGVAAGRNPGVYTDWGKAQESILGWKGPKFKKFATREEAEQWVRSLGIEKVTLYDGDDTEELEQPAKKVKKAPAKGSSSAAENPKAAGSKQGVTTTDVLVVYTDGSSRGNGKVGAMAGVGVYFGPGDPRNVSERLEGKLQTNQRAELTAILRTLQIVDKDSPLEIRTDSKYSIQCVTEWYMNWQKNDWQTKDGAVKNKDLVQAIRALLSERDARGVPTQFTWVKGHANDPGNIAADRLAVSGASKPL